MNLRKRLTAFLVALIMVGAPCAFASGRGWEQQKTERSDARSAAKWNDVEIKTARGALIITTNVRIQIKVFTILGQTVSTETLSPGTWQLTMPAHGVYIVKANDLTCKVAV